MQVKKALTVVLLHWGGGHVRGLVAGYFIAGPDDVCMPGASAHLSTRTPQDAANCASDKDMDDTQAAAE